MTLRIPLEPIMARHRRQQRQLRIARFLCRLLRLDEVEPLPIGEYAVAAGYVTLWNDVRPVVKAAGDVAHWRGRSKKLGVATTGQDAMRELVRTLDSYYAAYPDHLR